MARTAISQTDFTTGEISPLLLGRTDIDKYFAGLASAYNFIIHPQGPLSRRMGTRFAYEVKDQTQPVRLRRFEFSTEQAYILEFGHQYMRIFKDGGIVLDPVNPVEVVTPWSTQHLADLYFTQSADVLYVAHPDFQTRKISRTSHTTWTIDKYVTTDGPYLSSTPLETVLQVTNVVDRETIRNTAAEFAITDEGKYIEYYVDGDPTIGLVKTFVSANEVIVEPKENVIAPLSEEVTYTAYSAGTSATVSASVFVRGNVGAYLRIEYPADSGTIYWALVNGYVGTTRTQVTIDAALTMVSVANVNTLTHHDRTITATITSTENLFAATDVDRHLRMNFSSQQVAAVITAFTTATSVNVTLNRALPLESLDPTRYLDDGKTDDYKLGAWSDSTGWPSVVTFHQERLCFAATYDEPQTIWMSKSSDYENFAPTGDDSSVADDNGLTYTIASSKVNSIQWMESAQVLLIGTVGAEWQMSASTTTSPITPTDITLTEQTAYGSKQSVPPVRVGSSVMFAQRPGHKLRELAYTDSTASFAAVDVSVLSEHILRDGGGVVDLAYAQEPSSVVWLVLTDGTLAALTYVKEQDVYAWHRHELSGGVGEASAVVESIAVAPSSSGDVVYMSVKRVLDGVTTRYIETVEPEFRPTSSTDKVGMWYVDSGLSYEGPPITAFTGAQHLAGRTVTPIADGSVLPDIVVDGSGNFDLDDPASYVIIGLPYVSYIKTLPLEGKVDDGGTSQGRTKRIDKLMIRVLDTLGVYYGTDLANLDVRSFRDTDDVTDVSPPLQSDDLELSLDIGHDTRNQYYVAHMDPYPLTILSLMPMFKTENR